MLFRIPVVHFQLLPSISFHKCIKFVHSPTEEHLGCFPFGVIINVNAMGILVQVFLWKCAFLLDLYFGIMEVLYLTIGFSFKHFSK